MFELRKNIINEISKSISKNFDVPSKEALGKTQVLVTGLIVYLLNNYLEENITNGKEVASVFNKSIGKSDEAMETIIKMFGDSRQTAEEKFREHIEEYLGVDYNNPFSKFYFLRIDTLCQTLIEQIKDIDRYEIVDGKWDYK